MTRAAGEESLVVFLNPRNWEGRLAEGYGEPKEKEMFPMGCPNERTLSDELFSRQVERLLSRGWHEAMGMAEESFRHWLDFLRTPPHRRVLDEIPPMEPGYIPFLLVVPHKKLSIARQMELLIVEKKRGYASLDCAKLWNSQGIGESDLPYIVCGVDDGALNVGQITADATTEIRRACRNGLIFEEAIALAVHSPESLIHHGFALVDSDYQGESPVEGSNSLPRHQCVPELWFGSGGPTQSYNRLESKVENRGVPSCHHRLFLDRR